jgi:hypothetical protein
VVIVNKPLNRNSKIISVIVILPFAF